MALVALSATVSAGGCELAAPAARAERRNELEASFTTKCIRCTHTCCAPRRVASPHMMHATPRAPLADAERAIFKAVN